jgi:RNA polymerase sigma-70 factor (ECF subfamily)
MKHPHSGKVSQGKSGAVPDLKCGTFFPDMCLKYWDMIEARTMESANVLNRYDAIRMNEEKIPEVADADAQLMLRFKDGDTVAFDRLFARYTPVIINFAYRFVRDRQVAEELAQEVFLRVYEGAAKYRVQSRFSTWLYRIATNVCLNEIRKPRFRVVHEPLSGGFEPDPGIPSSAARDGQDKILERQAIVRVIKEVLDRMPEKQRAAFVLNKYQELSYSEVAEVMKTSEKAVKSLIHRARETLAERLKLLMPELLRQ